MFVPMDSSNDQQSTRERPYWILIGAGAAGTNRYAWTQINDTDATGGFPDFSGAFSMSGGSGADDWPAYEITGRKDVPPDTKVLAHISASGKFWIFKYEGGGGGASITAEEVDGTPSYTSSTTLRFDQADGFVLSQPSAGVVRVDLAAASTTQSGVVSTGSQSFAGAKYFTQGVAIDGSFSVDNAAGFYTSGFITYGFSLDSPQISLNSGQDAGTNLIEMYDGYGKSILVGCDGSYSTQASRTVTMFDGNGDAQPGTLFVNGVIQQTGDGNVWKPASMADSAAPNGSVYYSSTQSKLVYKDGGGTVNNLY